jgi:hypothetical protein
MPRISRLSPLAITIYYSQRPTESEKVTKFTSLISFAFPTPNRARKAFVHPTLSAYRPEKCNKLEGGGGWFPPPGVDPLKPDTRRLINRCLHNAGCRWKVAVHNFGCVVVKVPHKSPNGPFVVANCSVVVVEVQKNHYWVHCKVQSHHIVRGLWG